MNRAQWGAYRPLLLALFLLLCASEALAKGSFLVGNETSSTQGPNGDGASTTNFSTGSNTLVIPRASALQPSNIRLTLNVDTASGANNGQVFCVGMSTTSPITLESKFIDSGASYGGHKLFKTNIQGLYFTAYIHNITTKAITASEAFYIGDQAQQPVNFDNNKCGFITGYQVFGGFVATIDLEFYNDATFNPDTSGSISLLSSDGSHFSLKNYNPGKGYALYSIKATLDLNNVVLSSPTCFTYALSGSSVVASTVKMGTYNPATIIDGATPVDFDIALNNCYRVTNIETRLVSSVVGYRNPPCWRIR
ncbi:fimbrial protein [Pseudocitrobacter cyperus]|uniref:Fimbrial protein n=1 Tax=Pseudocitrobacter cyperus TaxID=3112843 RepID=A0ABV0HHP1_9ENTR